MKRSELKQVLKPLVKQCIREVIIEEGLLSNVVTEVVKGLSNASLLVEQKAVQTQEEEPLLEIKRLEAQEEEQRKIKQQKIKILNAAGFGDEIFEGTRALNNSGNENGAPAVGSMAGVAHDDPGIDISNIMTIGGNRWKDLI